MALHHSATTVGTSATLLLTIPDKSEAVAVLIFNDDNSAIWIGDSTVSTFGCMPGTRYTESLPRALLQMQ